jgi:polar amino acid transport system substrate-binding protein
MRNDLLVSHRTPDGGPKGLAPSVAAAFAERLSVPLTLVPYATPGELAASASEDSWDVAMLGSDPARAQYVDFTAPYCEIEATYAVPDASPIQSVEEVDTSGTRIAVCAKAAYDLWLERNIKQATVERIEGHEPTYEHFMSQKLEAIAGLRWKLGKDQEKHLPGCRLLPGRFMSVEQAACAKKGREEGFRLLSEFIEEVKANGQVLAWMQEFGVDDRLIVAAPAA